METINGTGYVTYGLVSYALAYMLYLLVKTAGEFGGMRYSTPPYDSTHLILKRRSAKRMRTGRLEELPIYNLR